MSNINPNSNRFTQYEWMWDMNKGMQKLAKWRERTKGFPANIMYIIITAWCDSNGFCLCGKLCGTLLLCWECPLERWNNDTFGWSMPYSIGCKLAVCLYVMYLLSMFMCLGICSAIQYSVTSCFVHMPLVLLLRHRSRGSLPAYPSHLPMSSSRHPTSSPKIRCCRPSALIIWVQCSVGCWCHYPHQPSRSYLNAQKNAIPGHIQAEVFVCFFCFCISYNIKDKHFPDNSASQNIKTKD